MKTKHARLTSTTLALTLVFGELATAQAAGAEAPSPPTPPTESAPAHPSWISHMVNSVKAITGSGEVKTEPRTVIDFDAIRLEDSSDLEIQVGSEYAVSVTADDNVLPLIVTRVKGHTLLIESTGSYHTRHTPKIVIKLPTLMSLTIDGSGDVHIRGLDGGALKLAIEGSGDIQAEGQVDQLAVVVDGSGDVNALHLLAKGATVAVSGSGDVAVAPREMLDVTINGSGDVRYHSDTARVQSQINGSGSVRHD